MTVEIAVLLTPTLILTLLNTLRIFPVTQPYG